MLQFHSDIPHAERKELGQRLRSIRICDTLYQLVYRTHGVRSHVGARIVIDHVEYEVEKRIGEMNADLGAGTSDGVNDLDLAHSSAYASTRVW